MFEKKIGIQKGNTRSQDHIDITKLSCYSFDPSLCASGHCHHQCLLPTGLTGKEIDEFNQNLRDQFRHAIKKWNASSISHKESRPREGGYDIPGIDVYVLPHELSEFN